MIVGRGLLANALQAIDNDKYLFYVNGISNSVIEEIPDDNFEFLEIDKISKKIADKIFVYCSTIQVNSSRNYNRLYVQHKYKMENLIKEKFSKYRIVRTSNLVGNNPWNKHTLFNYLYNSLKNGDEIQVFRSTVRNILDVEDFIKLLGYYLCRVSSSNSVVNIVNPDSYTMGEILNSYENIFSKKFLLAPAEIDIAYFEAPCEFSALLMNACEINLDGYLERVIKKYYQPIKKPY